jgi:hypothetical protein
MKRIVLAFVLVILMVGGAYAQDRCYSTGLMSADQIAKYESVCVCGVELYPAAADATLVVYKGQSAVAGQEIFKTNAVASGSPTGFLGGTCLDGGGGVYIDIGGAGAAAIIWYR